tara:strand:+ start:4134 stop:4709 length:576 start_codon:yes stop_codon:yes gene_type:complete
MVKLNIKNNLLVLCTALLIGAGCVSSDNGVISALGSGSSMENPSSGSSSGATTELTYIVLDGSTQEYTGLAYGTANYTSKTITRGDGEFDLATDTFNPNVPAGQTNWYVAVGGMRANPGGADTRGIFNALGSAWTRNIYLNVDGKQYSGVNWTMPFRATSANTAITFRFYTESTRTFDGQTLTIVEIPQYK